MVKSAGAGSKGAERHARDPKPVRLLWSGLTGEPSPKSSAAGAAIHQRKEKLVTTLDPPSVSARSTMGPPAVERPASGGQKTGRGRPSVSGGR